MKQPLFSLLMANFNNGKYIKDAINSVLCQTYQHFEVIIVDDASTDNSEEIIQSYLSDSRIYFYKNEVNLKCGGAKRKAADLARGEILGFLDPDDVLLPEAIRIVVAAHLEYPKSSIIHTSHYVCDENLNVIRKAYGASEIPDGESYLSYGKGITAFATFKRALYQITPGIDATFKRAVDQDLYYKLEEVGEVKFIDQPLYKYRVNPNGISSFENLSKSRYWFVRAKENAFVRRKSRPELQIKNIGPGEIKAWWSILYATKSSDAFRRLNICKGFYWLGLSFWKSPVDRYFLLKAKSLLVNTFFHRLLKRVVT